MNNKYPNIEKDYDERKEFQQYTFLKWKSKQREIENRIIERLLKIAYDQGYNLDQIDTLNDVLLTDLDYYLKKCDDDIEIIKEVLQG